MKNEILSNIDNPGQLEKLYRGNKATFKQAFTSLYPDLKDSNIAGFWKERLNYKADAVSWGGRKELIFVIAASLTAGLIAKLPGIFSFSEEFFYPRNIGFIVFPFLSAYFVWKSKPQLKNMMLIWGAVLAAVLYINVLPDNKQSDTLILACIHLPLFLWSVSGFAFAGDQLKDYGIRLAYLRYNGELVVISSLILIAGIILTGITIGLFSLIGFDIEKLYIENVVVFGLAAIPILGTYLTQTMPQLVSNVSPVIAKIFSPLVLLTLVTYLIAIIFSGKDPYNDRDFLLIFNVMLIGVMAIIFFSVAAESKTEKNQAEILVLLLLSIVTIIVNGIALSAIVFRITEWGITPNRLAVLGGNILILTNLLLVTLGLFRSLTNKADIAEVGKAIALFLPVYIVWAFVITFLFPLFFWFR